MPCAKVRFRLLKLLNSTSVGQTDSVPGKPDQPNTGVKETLSPKNVENSMPACLAGKEPWIVPSVQGMWSLEAAYPHINILKLGAIQFSLQCWLHKLQGHLTRMQLNNSTAVAYIKEAPEVASLKGILT